MKKLLDGIVYILLWVWQILQHIFAGFLMLGYIIFQSSGVKFIKTEKKDGVIFILLKDCNYAVSLGNFIFIDQDWIYGNDKKHITADPHIKDHEYGHSIQSRYLGIFYLFVVGIPSAIRNVQSKNKRKAVQKKYNTLFQINREFDKISAWYYGGFPENWADKLGGVKR